MRISFLRTLLNVAGLVVAMAAPLQAHAYKNWFVFGDSLSDTGNNAILLGIDADQVIDGNSYIPTYPYASGRYSNNEVWTTSFAASLGLQATASLAGGNIYAYGGARTRVVSPDGAPPLRDQVKTYLGDYGGAADGNALYVIAGGGNNARDTLDAIATGEVPILSTIFVEANRYATDVGRMVDRLQAAGAEHIVVWNTPDISRAPAVIAEGDLAVGLAARVAGSMNSALSKRLAGEEGVVVFDTYALFDQIVDHGADYGLVNTSDACGAIVGCDPSSYLFWDGIHPTSAGHQLLADAMLGVTAVPEPAMVWLFAAGLGVLWLRRRGARALAGDSDEARVLRPRQAAACTLRIAFGPRAGQRVLTVRGVMPRDADLKQTLCADNNGFSPHAAVCCGPEDRQALEPLCRYITRPARANERVQTNAAGQVVLKLKTAWRDGTPHLMMSPLEFMQRLAALVPRPRLHLIRLVSA